MAKSRKFAPGDAVSVNQRGRRDLRQREGTIIDFGPEKGSYRVAFGDGGTPRVADVTSQNLDAIAALVAEGEYRIRSPTQIVPNYLRSTGLQS
jgi:hypothetical protein